MDTTVKPPTYLPETSLAPAERLTWDPRLPLDVALNESSVTGIKLYEDADLLARYGLSQTAYEGIKRLPAFQQQVRDAIQELESNGLTVKRKASAQFEYYIDRAIPRLMDSEYTEPKVKLDIIKFLGQVAGKDGRTGEEALGDVKPVQGIPSLNIILQTSPVPLEAPRIVSEQ